MTPKPENTTSYTLESEPCEPSSAYVNSGYDNNEKSVIPHLEMNGDMKSQPGVQSSQRHIDFDDLLPHLGEFGRYQIMLFLLMIPFAFFVAFVYFSQIFITLVPDEHWCFVPELANMTADQRYERIIHEDLHIKPGSGSNPWNYSNFCFL